MSSTEYDFKHGNEIILGIIEQAKANLKELDPYDPEPIVQYLIKINKYLIETNENTLRERAELYGRILEREARQAKRKRRWGWLDNFREMR